MRCARGWRGRCPPRDLVAEVARAPLKLLEQGPGHAAPAGAVDDEHPLDLAGAVGQPLQPAAAEGLAVLVADDERPAWRAPARPDPPSACPARKVQAVVHRRDVVAHALDERGGRLLVDGAGAKFDHRRSLAHSGERVCAVRGLSRTERPDDAPGGIRTRRVLTWQAGGAGAGSRRPATRPRRGSSSRARGRRARRRSPPWRPGRPRRLAPAAHRPRSTGHRVRRGHHAAPQAGAAGHRHDVHALVSRNSAWRSGAPPRDHHAGTGSAPTRRSPARRSRRPAQCAQRRATSSEFARVAGVRRSRGT